jgi:predicted flap endonuclease-1-like 5' DNA nuclease
MTETTTLSRRGRIPKAGLAVLGLPSRTASRVGSWLASARDSAGDVWERLSGEAHEFLDASVEEGEHLVEAVRRRLVAWRDTLGTQVRRGATTAGETAGGLETALTEPIVPLDAVDGIGTGYAARLARAGVVSTQSLVDRCRTAESTDRLARQADVPATLLEKWAASADLTRIDGIGPETMSLLNRIGIGTLDALASADPEDLHGRAADLGPGPVAAVPSARTLAGWIGQASVLADD